MKIAEPISGRHLYVLLAVLLLSFIVYWNSLEGDFIWDDKDVIINHERYLGDWKNLFSIFTEPFFGKAAIYRPLLIISYMLDFNLWHLNSFGFHYTNILLHTFNGFMVYLITFTLLKKWFLSLFSGIIFTVHPIQTEAVAWISGRNDVLLTSFSLLAIFFYLHFFRQKGMEKKIVLFGFIGWYWCALLTKESGVILPFLIMLIDSHFSSVFQTAGILRKRMYLLMLLLVLLYFITRLCVLGKVGLAFPPLGKETYLSLLNVPVTYAYYFKMLVFPRNNLKFSLPPVTSIKNAVFIVSSMFIVMLVSIVVISWKRCKECAFMIFWFFMGLIPVSGMCLLTIPVMEHRLYLVNVGFSMMLPFLVFRFSSTGVEDGPSKMRNQIIVSILLLFLTLVFSFKSVLRIPLWKSEYQFWSRVVKDSPFSVVAHNNLGLVYFEKGEYQKAQHEFMKALSLDPGAAKVHANLAAVYLRKRLYPEAINAYETAIRIRPRMAEFHSGLGNLYFLMLKESATSSGKEVFYQKSLAHYQKAVQLEPRNPEVHSKLGDLYYFNKSFEKALEEYTKAVKYDPYNAEIYNNLGLAQFKSLCYDEAQKAFARAIELLPTFVEAHNNLGLVYLKKRLYQEALNEFLSALELAPASAEIYFNIALVYLGGFKDTVKGSHYLKRSLDLSPYHERSEAIKRFLQWSD